MNRPDSSSNEPLLSIGFCGYSCWAKPSRSGDAPGREVMRQMLNLPEGACIPDAAEIELADGRRCTVTKVSACLGGCTRLHPTVKIESGDAEERLKASSPSAVLQAIATLENTESPLS